MVGHAVQSTGLGRKGCSLKLAAVIASVVAAWLAVAVPALGQSATQDSVVGAAVGRPTGVEEFELRYNAFSGPSGENPTGTVTQVVPLPPLVGDVTCLAVTGRRAVVGVRVSAVGLSFYIFVVDGGPGGQDEQVAEAATGAATDCDSATTVRLAPILSGDIVVTDAHPLPVSTGQCKNGGWRNFANFTNQGQCVMFVVRRGCRVQRGTVSYRDPYCANPIQTRDG